MNCVKSALSCVRAVLKCSFCLSGCFEGCLFGLHMNLISSIASLDGTHLMVARDF